MIGKTTSESLLSVNKLSSYLMMAGEKSWAFDNGTAMYQVPSATSSIVFKNDDVFVDKLYYTDSQHHQRIHNDYSTVLTTCVTLEQCIFSAAFNISRRKKGSKRSTRLPKTCCVWHGSLSKWRSRWFQAVTDTSSTPWRLSNFPFHHDDEADRLAFNRCDLLVVINFLIGRWRGYSRFVGDIVVNCSYHSILYSTWTRHPNELCFHC